MDSGGLLRRFSHGWMTRLLFAASTRLLQVSAQEQDGHLRDGRLWRRGAAATMADARTYRGINGNPDVRTVHGSVLRDHRQIDRASIQG